LGRRVELEALADALRAACRLVLVSGDAGVGKTRLVTEAARSAANDGSLVLQTACLPLDVKLPLLPFIEALRGLASVVGPTALADALARMPAHAVEQLARLAPEVAGRDVMDDAMPDQQWQQTRLFAAVDQVLAGVAAGRHVVLVVEDVHWADAASLDLMTYLRASRSGAARSLLVTCRGDEELEPHVLQWLTHARRLDTVRLELSGLSRDELAELAAHVLAAAPSEELVDELRSRTDGNPYLAEELIGAALSQPGPSHGIALPRRLPGELATILVGRTRRVSRAARSTLDVLAVARRSMAESLVAQVTGLAPRSWRRRCANSPRRGCWPTATSVPFWVAAPAMHCWLRR
jgi:predicted ATPase